MTFKPLSDADFAPWEIKVLNRPIYNHTYEEVYLKMVGRMSYDICDECQTK